MAQQALTRSGRRVLAHGRIGTFSREPRISRSINTGCISKNSSLITGRSQQSPPLQGHSPMATYSLQTSCAAPQLFGCHSVSHIRLILSDRYLYREGVLLRRRCLSRTTRPSAGDGSGERDDIDRGLDPDCWKCESPVGRREFFCECGAAQRLDGRLDYFEMFGQEKSVFVDQKGVDKSFKNMQRAFHPDLFATKSEDEQAISAANSAMVNKAYQTLVQPMARVKYLMHLLGSRVFEENGQESSEPASPVLLMEIMEIREALENCAARSDAEAIMNEATTAIQASLRDMDGVLRAGGGKDELHHAAVRLRYLHRIEEEARRVMHRLEDEEDETPTLD